MTLTPAIKEATKRLEDRLRGANGYLHINDLDLITALLSVVAAEEGRKYEELVKLHREWVAAKNALVEAKPFTVAWDAAYDKYRRRCIRAESALAQWEAK